MFGLAWVWWFYSSSGVACCGHIVAGCVAVGCGIFRVYLGLVWLIFGGCGCNGCRCLGWFLFVGLFRCAIWLSLVYLVWFLFWVCFGGWGCLRCGLLLAVVCHAVAFGFVVFVFVVCVVRVVGRLCSTVSDSVWIAFCVFVSVVLDNCW